MAKYTVCFKKKVLGIVILFFSLFVSSSLYATQPTSVLRIPLQSSKIFFDPSGIQDSQSLFVSRQINCQLVRNLGYSFELEAAESVKYLSPTKILLKLKKDIRFNDGSPVTSDDVVTSFNYIKNSRQFLQNLSRWVKEIEIVNKQTMIFHLFKESPQFLNVLSSTTYPIFSKKFLDNSLRDHSLWKNPISCGGYKVSQFTDTVIKLVPVTNGLPITFILISTNQINANKMKDFDIVSLNVTGDSTDLKNFNEVNIYDPVQFFILLNSKSKFWKTKNQRCQFLNDIDVTNILNKYGSLAIKAKDFFPKGTLGYESTGSFFQTISHKAHLSNRFDKNTTNNQFCVSYLTVSIQANFKSDYLSMFKNIYPNTKMHSLPSTKNFGKDFIDSNCDVFLFAWKSSYNDGYEYLTFLENKKVDISRIQDASISQSILNSQEILKSELRSKYYQSITQKLAGNCIIRPLITIPEKKIYIRKNLITPGIGLVPTHLYYLGNVSKSGDI
jgi:hypothetical protein